MNSDILKRIMKASLMGRDYAIKLKENFTRNGLKLGANIRRRTVAYAYPKIYSPILHPTIPTTILRPRANAL